MTIRLSQKLADLPGTLLFRGEFGAEINSFVPFVHFLHQAGEMAGRKIETYRGMRPYYFFLPDEQYTESVGDREFVPAGKRPAWLPNRDDHFSTKRPDEWFPDYRTQFMTDFGFEKPLLLIHNKYCSEWGGPPVNFIPLDILDEIFRTLSDTFQIVYFPAVTNTVAAEQFTGDHQYDYPFDEEGVLAAHPKVISLPDLLASREEETYNSLKLRLFAAAYVYIVVQGGNVHLSSLFSGNITVALDVNGSELGHSYARGHFRYASNPRPKLLICRSADDLLIAIDDLSAVRIFDGGASFCDKGVKSFERFGAHKLAFAHGEG